MMRKLNPTSGILMVVCLICQTDAYAQVRLKRSVGEYEQVKVQKVMPAKIIEEKECPVKVSGRLNLGYQMTKDIQGNKATTLSSLTGLGFSTPFGVTGDVSFGKQNLTNGRLQDVGFGMTLKKELFSVSFNLKDLNKDTIAENNLHSDENNNISLGLNLGFIKGLPLNIAYSRGKNLSVNSGTNTQKGKTSNLSFNIQGRFFEKTNWNLGVVKGETEDVLTNRKTDNLGLRVGLILPVLEDRLSINCSVSPNVTRNYLPEGGSTKIIQQSGNTTFNLKVTEKLNSSLGISYSRNESRINGATKSTSSSLTNNLNFCVFLSSIDFA